MDVAANLSSQDHKKKNNSTKKKKLKTPFDQHTWSNKKHFMLIQNFFSGFLTCPLPTSTKVPNHSTEKEYDILSIKL